jgi:WD40 repeat protein
VRPANEVHVVVAFDSSLLLSYYQNREGVSGNGGGVTAGALSTKTKYAPTPPWDPRAIAAPEPALVKQVLNGGKFINENAAQVDLAGASDDYRKLFALYQGLNSLSGLADSASGKAVSDHDKARYAAAFVRGLSETSAYVNNLNLDKVRLTEGTVGGTAKTGGVATQPSAYTSKVLHAGSSADPVDAFQGAVAFTVTVKKGGVTTNVPVDLAEMGTQTRSMANVVNYLNGKLASAGAFTKFATARTPAAPSTIKVGNTTVKLPAGQDQWALTLKTDTSEQVTLSAPTNGAVYVTQLAGSTNPDNNIKTNDSDQVNQLLKFQTDGTAPPQPAGEANYVPGRLFSETLPPEVGAVHASAVASDGSLYVLADVTNTTDGQTIKGTQDVALSKYDSAGKLLFTRTLGAGVSATGLALSVSADGKVAVGGSVTGSLTSGETAASQTTADSFVSLYDANGQETWTQRRGAVAEDQVNALTFGADGTVYVAGQTKSAMPGSAGAIGGWDSYVSAVVTTAKGLPSTTFTTQFGSGGDDKVIGIAINGTSLVVAGNEGSHGVLRQFDVSAAGPPPQTATRDLGDLGGGSVLGVAFDGGQVVVGGSTRNGALNGGTVTSSASGDMDAFAARLSSDLSNQPSDAIAYYGGSGYDKATGFAVSGGKAWLTGQTTADLPGLAPVGTKDGFVVSLDVASGAVGYSTRFTAKDGLDAPTTIAVAPGGASILDQLGLPQGVVDASQSKLLIDNTALRPGDTFSVKTHEGGAAVKVTIAADETLDTLATKIQRAAGFAVTVSKSTVNGDRSLLLKPSTNSSTVELVAGPAGHDALASLGLTAGVIHRTLVVNGKSASADGKGNVYGLHLDSNINLNSADAIKKAQSELSDAMSNVRTAYKDLLAQATPQSAVAAAAPKGPVPAYLTNQIANYQAALNRLANG